MATFAIGTAGAANAALFAVAMLANDQAPSCAKRLKFSAPSKRKQRAMTLPPVCVTPTLHRCVLSHPVPPRGPCSSWRRAVGPDGRMPRKSMGTKPCLARPSTAQLGVLGGGQLGRMFVHQAQAMGYFTAVLDADPTSPNLKT